MAIPNADGVSDQFAERLRLLVVDEDDDPLVLKTLQKRLRKYPYEDEVTKCNSAEIALKSLHHNKNDFDMVLMNVRMPGFELVEQFALSMGLPVFMMMSTDYCENVFMKGEPRGACDYKKKQEELKHVTHSAPIKPRFVWSVELDQKFLDAINQLGPDKAYPKKILELMNVPGLSREQVASRLQKYRLSQRNQDGINSSYIELSHTNFGTISSLHGMDFQAQPTSQIPGHRLAALQPLHKPSNISPISITDQSNITKFERPNVGFSKGEQVRNNIDQMNMLHGIATTVDPKQLASLNQSNVYRLSLLNIDSGVGLAQVVSSKKILCRL